VADDRSARKRPPKLVAVDQQTFALTLTHHGDGQDVAQTIHATPAESRLGPETVAPITLKRLGYDLKEELGRGGLGSVHLAQQQAFDRAVAIKRLLVQGDRMAAMKFYAEAVATAALEHPNIVPVHDLLSDQQGRLQLVMKRVEGRTWKHLLHPTKAEAAETLTLDDHLDILVKVVEAVSFAHDKGFLHRDLKPDNVMVGAHGEVLVMDWGCAVAFGDHHQHPIVPRVEEIDQITGTPAYMAPEMVLIEQHATGPHSDVYLLGPAGEKHRFPVRRRDAPGHCCCVGFALPRDCHCLLRVERYRRAHVPVASALCGNQETCGGKPCNDVVYPRD